MKTNPLKVLLPVMMLVLMITTASLSLPPEQQVTMPEAPKEPSRDVPLPQSAKARADTVWIGGMNGDGVAYVGGVWDWDTPPLGPDGQQGWQFVDETENPGVYFDRVVADDFTAHGDPCTPMFAGSTGQIWCGIHEDEADERDFVTGMGYQDDMCQKAESPMYAIDPLSEAIDIEFKYFNHTESGYDSTIIYILCYDSGVSLIEEYEVDGFDGIHGSYQSPVTYGTGNVEVPAGTLDPGTAYVALEFRMISDGGWSDEDGYHDCPCGPFAADDITFQIGTSNYFFDFETGAQAWTFTKCAGVGSYGDVVAAGTYQAWLDSAGVGSCALSNNAIEMVDEVSSPYSPPGHPSGHKEMVFSSKVPRYGYYPPVYSMVLVRMDLFKHLPRERGTFHRVGYMYYPYTSPANPIPHWSPRCGTAAWEYSLPGVCGTKTFNLSAGYDPIPADWDSLRVVFEVYCSCEDFAIGDCVDEGDTKGSPVFDNVQVGLTSTQAWIGDLVWNDENRDGIQNEEDAGIPGVEIDLRENGGDPVGQTVTDENGYLFELNDDIWENGYILTVELPTYYVFSPAFQGGNSSLNSDVNPATGEMGTLLDPGEVNLSKDAGMYRWCTDEDIIGLYTAAGDSGYSHVDTTSTTPFDIYLLLQDITDTGGIDGWECNIGVTSNVLVTGLTVQGAAIPTGNVPGDIAVSLLTPLPWAQDIWIATIRLMVLDTSPAFLHISAHGASAVNPPAPAYLSGTDHITWIPLTVASCAMDLPAFEINRGTCGAISVDVEPPGYPEMTWNLTCNLGVNYTSSGDEKLVGMVADTYTLTWNDIPGWATPSPNPVIQALPPGGVINFAGTYTNLTSVNAPDIPGQLALHRSYPNPFNPMATIGFDLPRSQHVRLTVYTVDGRRVTLLVDERRTAGRHEVVWNGCDDHGRQVPSGVYFYRLEAGKFSDTDKMVLVK